MRKLIHSDFELDLSNFKLSDTEENNWFSDSFFSKYSFPFNIDLDSDLDQYFGFILLYNSNYAQTSFNLLYVHGNVIEVAVLEIESHQEKLSLVLYFGFEQIPTFEKKLSELPLHNFRLPSTQSIYDYANIVIKQKYPAVDFNFPQIHIDKIDINDEMWNAFEGVINNRENNLFLTNTVDTVTYVNNNRNIMQPLPYFIYLLKQIAVDAGYVLAGDILQDLRLQKACLYGDVEYYSTKTLPESIIILKTSSDQNYYDSVNDRLIYYSNTNIAIPGKYTITGTIKTQNRSNKNSYFNIKFRGVIIWEKRSTDTTLFLGSTFNEHEIDLTITTVEDINPNDLIIESHQDTTVNETIVDLAVACIYEKDISGSPISSVQNESKVDLTKAVPDMTVIDFVKTIKNWFNYDLSVIGNTLVMNKIKSQIKFDTAYNLEHKEIKRPMRTFTSGMSFLLKFQDIDNPAYPFLPVFQSKDKVVNSNFITDDKTITIEVNALPLPYLTRNSIRTAYALESNNSKVFLVKYDGMFFGNNYAQSNEEYLIPEVHKVDWEYWFNFRINSQGFRWSFYLWEEELVNLKAKTQIFAYNKYHIVKTINKTEQVPNLFLIEVETYSLE